nr:hypothetical protein Iba_chr01bCG10490 [Ipomoea batatas]
MPFSLFTSASTVQVSPELGRRTEYSTSCLSYTSTPSQPNTLNIHAMRFSGVEDIQNPEPSSGYLTPELIAHGLATLLKKAMCLALDVVALKHSPWPGTYDSKLGRRTRCIFFEMDFLNSIFQQGSAKKSAVELEWRIVHWPSPVPIPTPSTQDQLLSIRNRNAIALPALATCTVLL